MLFIRREQNEQLREARLRAFESAMLPHLAKCFPEKCRDLGQAGVRQSVRTGVENARKYGIRNRYDVARYIDLMYVLCFDFDTSRRTPWAAEVLTEEAAGPREKMDRLYEKTDRELKAAEARRSGGR